MRIQTPDGSYSAFMSGTNGVRFIKGQQGLIKEAEVPADVVAYLKDRLGVQESKSPSRFEQTMADAPEELKAPAVEEPITFDDFEDDTTAPDPWAPPADDMLPSLMPLTMVAPQITRQSLPMMPEHVSLEPTRAFSSTETKSIMESETPVESEAPTELDPFSIYAASLEDLARAMYERFGVWTVFTGQLPEPMDISPLSSKQMTNYDRGLAYQQAKFAIARGLLTTDGATQVMEEARRSRAVSGMPAPIPGEIVYSEEESKQMNSFEYRTSPRGVKDLAMQESAARFRRNPDDLSELLVEPDLNNLDRNPAIKPVW